MSLADRIAAAQGGLPAPVLECEPAGPVVDRALLTDALDPAVPRDPVALARHVRSAVADALARDESELTAGERARRAQELADDLVGLGPLEQHLRDDTVTEVMVNGPGQVFVERDGRLHLTDTRFDDEEHLRRAIDRMVSRVGRRVDESSPMVDARLPDGSRLNVVLPPLALDGPIVTIRAFAPDTLGIEDLVRHGTLTTAAAEFLAAAVRGRASLLVSGGTGAGKTTTLNILSGFLDSQERIITIEDAAELRLQQPHVVRLESRPPNLEGAGEITVRDLVRNALRMRPDRIIVGEVRDAAALDMLTAMSTGHDGSICTVHANSPREALGRIETMVLTGGTDLPLRAIRETLVGAVDLIVHQERTPSGQRRIRCITEVVGLEGDIVTLQDVFALGPDGRLAATGIRPRVLARIAERGVDLGRVDLTPPSRQDAR